MREAEKLRTKLLGEADSLKVARTRWTIGALLDQWLPQHEVDATAWALRSSPGVDRR